MKEAAAKKWNDASNPHWRSLVVRDILNASMNINEEAVMVRFDENLQKAHCDEATRSQTTNSSVEKPLVAAKTKKQENPKMARTR